MRIQLSPSVIYTLTMAPCFQRHIHWTNRMKSSIPCKVSVCTETGKAEEEGRNGSLELSRNCRIEAINFNLRFFPCLKVKSCTMLTGSW